MKTEAEGTIDCEGRDPEQGRLPPDQQRLIFAMSQGICFDVVMAGSREDIVMLELAPRHKMKRAYDLVASKLDCSPMDFELRSLLLNQFVDKSIPAKDFGWDDVELHLSWKEGKGKGASKASIKEKGKSKDSGTDKEQGISKKQRSS